MAVTEEEKQLREAVRASELTAADEERRRLQRHVVDSNLLRRGQMLSLAERGPTGHWPPPGR